MSEFFLTAEQAAERLNLHPKTVLRFIHEGRLAGTRIGKAWRIRQSDLETFAGGARPAEAPPARVTAVADLSDVSPDMAQRLANALQASLMTAKARPRPVHLSTAYEPDQGMFKVVIVADALDAAGLLQGLSAFADAFR
jgi:excisionase family DNA binding protein